MAPTPRARGDGGMPIDTPIFDTTVPALVLKTDSYALHHGGLGVVRSLGRLGIPVYGVYRERLMPAAVSSYLSGRFIWRGEVDDEGRFLDGMAMIGERLGRPAVLVPTDDLGAIMVSQHVATLSRWFRFPDPPTGLAPLVASKKGLYELCSKLGIPCPQVSYPSSRHDLEEFAAKAAFPVVAKAIEPWLVPAGAGLKSTSIIHSPEDLLDLYRRLEGNSAGNLLLQEYIPPDRAQDWFFHGYCDARSSCLVSFTGVKLRSYPPYAGATSLGRCQDNDTLRGHAEQLLETIGYRGIMDLDYRLDLRDGEYKLLDFNPRVGAQFRVFEDAAGVDVVRALIWTSPGGGAPPTAAGGPGVRGGAERSAGQPRIPPRRRPEPELVAVLAASKPQRARLVRPRRPGSVPPDVRPVPAQGRPARTPTSARPLAQRFDTKICNGEAPATTTVTARSAGSHPRSDTGHPRRCSAVRALVAEPSEYASSRAFRCAAG